MLSFVSIPKSSKSATAAAAAATEVIALPDTDDRGVAKDGDYLCTEIVVFQGR